MKATKLVIATPIFPPESGGPGTYTCAIAEKLYPKYECVIITYSDAPSPLAHTRVIAIRKSQNLLFRWCKYTVALFRELRTADIVYAQNAVASGFPAVIAGMLLRKPVIIKMVGDEAWERATAAGTTTKNIHDFLRAPEGGLKTKVFMAVQRFALRRAMLVTTPSLYLLDEVTRAYSLSANTTALNSNATEDIPLSSTPRHKYQIASVSRLVVWKHIDGLIRALTLVHKQFPDAVLKIAGVGPAENTLKKLVDELGVHKSVFFLGNLSTQDVRTLFSESEVYVLNSSYEGLPHTVLESFAAHTPVVATDIPGTNELVRHDTGFPIPVDNDIVLAETIASIFRDPSDAQKRAVDANAFFKRNFSWEHHVKILEEFFTRATHSTKG